MKRKYADYPNWERVLEKNYKNKYFNNSDFKGNISLLTAVKVKEKLVVEDELVIIDDGFKWLEIYPENNKNIAVSVSINNKDYLLQNDKCFQDLYPQHLQRAKSKAILSEPPHRALQPLKSN